MTNVFLRPGAASPCDVVLRDPTQADAGGYFGVLKRWTGSTWSKAKLKRYNGATWVSAILKRWTGSEWAQVDATGA